MWGYFSVCQIHNSTSGFWSARATSWNVSKKSKLFGCSDGIIVVNAELWFMVVMTEKYKIVTMLCDKSKAISVTTQCPFEPCPQRFGWSWCSHKAAQVPVLKSLPFANCKPKSIICLQRHCVIWPSSTRGCVNPTPNYAGLLPILWVAECL